MRCFIVPGGDDPTSTRARRAAATLLIGAWTALLAQPAPACTCFEPTSYGAVARADAVFEGRVLEIGASEPLGKVRSSDEEARVTIAVSRAWKGEVPDEVVVATSGTSASCGFPFAPGRSYVICARSRAGGLTTSLCSGTVPVEGGGLLRRALARLEAQGGAGMSQGAMAMPILEAIRHGEGAERSDAARALGELDIDPHPLMPTLIALADGSDPGARAAAISAIDAAESRSGRGSESESLVDTAFYVRALAGHDDDVRVAACRALARSRHAAHVASSALAVDALIDAAESPSRELSALALGLVADLESPPSRAEPLLQRALRASTSEVRRAGARGLVRMGPEGMASLQGDVLAEPENRPLAMDVIEILGREAAGSELAVATLVALTVTGHPASRSDALTELAEARPSAPVVRALVEAASGDSSEVVRAGAMGAVRHLGTKTAWQLGLLVHALSDPEATVRDQAVRVLGWMGPNAAAALPALRELLSAADDREAAQIRAAIGRVASDAGASPEH
jgi:hypothetical protein